MEKITERQRHLKFIQRMCEETGLAPTTLAKKAKVADTTITRFMKPESTLQSLTTKTLSALAQAAGYHSYEDAVLNPADQMNMAENIPGTFTPSLQKSEVMEVAEKVERLANRMGVILTRQQYLSATLDMHAKLKREEITGKTITDENVIVDIVEYLQNQQKQLDHSTS